MGGTDRVRDREIHGVDFDQLRFGTSAATIGAVETIFMFWQHLQAHLRQLKTMDLLSGTPLPPLNGETRNTFVSASVSISHR